MTIPSEGQEDLGTHLQHAGSVLRTLPGVRETRTYVVMEEVKNTQRLPVLG